jgi:hypothetical protein
MKLIKFSKLIKVFYLFIMIIMYILSCLGITFLMLNFNINIYITIFGSLYIGIGIVIFMFGVCNLVIRCIREKLNNKVAVLPI